MHKTERGLSFQFTHFCPRKYIPLGKLPYLALRRTQKTCETCLEKRRAIFPWQTSPLALPKLSSAGAASRHRDVHKGTALTGGRPARAGAEVEGAFPHHLLCCPSPAAFSFVCDTDRSFSPLPIPSACPLTPVYTPSGPLLWFCCSAAITLCSSHLSDFCIEMTSFNEPV